MLLVLVLVAACEKNDGSSGRASENAPASPAPGDPGGGGTTTPGNPPQGDPSTPPGARPNGPPVETRPPNAPSQTPAFPGQTRAPGHPTNVAFDVRVVARGLVVPWAVALLPDGAKLVTERAGRMRLIGADGAVSEPLAGVPQVVAVSQGGLLDVVLDPKFNESSLVFFSYSEPRNGGSGTAIARARLVREGDSGRLADVQVVWRMPQTRTSGIHFGSRIVFGRDGNLFITAGERGVGDGAENARVLANAHGKVIRIRPDGAIPPDNPFVGRSGALGEIWSFGHRNPQSAALHPKTGELWIVDHGPRGGDEVNIARAGKDYGWPTVSYGIDYSGSKIGNGITQLEGTEQPVYYWDPVIAPSGAAFYEGDAFPAWRGSLFIGALAAQHLARLTLEGDRVIGEERLLEDRNGRIRDVRVSPTGTIFVSDESKGEILELVPR